MKTIEIKEIWYRNFKGLRNYTLVPNGNDLDIFAQNGEGKTTLKDGFLWLVTGKNSDNKNDFSVKTLQNSGESVHGFEHEVGADLEIDGKVIRLQRILSEKWTKKRGSARDEFTGHTTKYLVDEVPVNEKEYKDRIAEICDESIFRLLTDLTYFNDAIMKWEDRRKLLVQSCGSISDADVIASDPALAALPEILGDRKLDDHKKWLADRRRKINDELKSLPDRIDEVQRSLPDQTGGNRKSVEKDLAKIRAEVAEKHQEKARLEAGGEVGEKRGQLADVRAQLSEMERTAKATADEQAREANKAVYTVRDRADELNRTINSKTRDIEAQQDAIGRHGADMESLREKWQQINAETFEQGMEEYDTVCVACGQDLPAERIQEARDKALAGFNASKAQRLEKNSAEGKQIKTAAGNIALLIEQARKEITGLEGEREGLPETKDEAGTVAWDTFLPPDYADVEAAEESLAVEIDQLIDGNKDALVAVTSAISAMQQQIRDLDEGLAAIAQGERSRKRIDELKAREEILNAEYEDLERQLFMIETFTKAQAALLTSKINGRFKLARFRLFETQINGGISDCCICTVDGVPYPDLNTGKKIRVGMDIIATLSEFYGIVCPIFADNSESVTGDIEAPGQLIRLIASSEDKGLRVETKTKEKING